MATIYASSMTLMPTHSDDTNAVVAKNHRIGVSLSGVADWLAEQQASDVITWLNKGYDVVQLVNKYLAQEAGIRPSIRTTTLKPSGTVSLLAGTSAGMHLPPFSRYIRRVRIGDNTPIVPLLQEAGIPHEPDAVSRDTLVFEFPIDRGIVRGQKEVSVWAKAQTVVMLQRFWADNMVSNTLSFNPETEGSQIEDLLTYTVPFIKTISLLPMKNYGETYAQLPEEQTTRDDIRERQKQIKDIDWSKFGGSDGEDSKFCTSDNCEM